MQTTTGELVLLIIITSVLILLLNGLIITLLYLYQKRRLLYQQNLNSLKLDYEKNLLNTQVEVQEQTFQTISKEIHDHINLELTLAKLNLNTLDWEDPEKVRNAVNSSISLITESIEDLSHLSRSMNMDVIKNMGLIKALQNEIQRIENITHLNVNYGIAGEPIFLESEKELVIFRIIQEAFNNILKHSKATSVNLVLDYGLKKLTIDIKDDGIGFDKEECLKSQTRTAGLSNMENRAGMFGGNVIVQSLPLKGTQINVTIPYN